MIDSEEICSLPDFQENVQHYLRQIQNTKKPITLIIDGDEKFIIQDAASYRAMLKSIEHAEAVKAVRQGIEEFERGGAAGARGTRGASQPES